MSALQILYQFANSFSFLVLAALGLAIIYGMMGIVNLAHGEFMMLGAYITIIFATNGVPLPLAIAFGAIFTGVFGLITDRLIICRLYSRTLDSVVATWGISMIMRQGVSLFTSKLTGSAAIQGVSTPLGTFKSGTDTYSKYSILLTIIAVILTITIYCVFMFTKFGLKSRATMQRSDIAAGLGINTNRMYAVTFTIGSMLAGLAGGLYAPTMTITPEFGTTFMMPSFITVIVGGANPLIGTILAGTSLGLVNSSVTILYGAFNGTMAMLLVAIVFIRVCPKGFTILVENISKRERGRAK